jgi:RNase P subunit RPR2
VLIVSFIATRMLFYFFTNYIIMTKKEIKKRYKKLLKDVETKDFYKIDLTNRFNCYICTCGHITKTRDVDSGVTPFMHTCEKCGHIARSTFYRDIKPIQEPTQEWYRPTLKELLKEKNNDGFLEHVFNGGLDVRQILTINIK